MTACARPSCPNTFKSKPRKKYCSRTCRQFMWAAMRSYAARDVAEGRTTLEFIEQLHTATEAACTDAEEGIGQ